MSCHAATGQMVAPALQQIADQTDLAQAVAFQNWYGSEEQNRAFAAAPDAPPPLSTINGSASAESGPIVVSGMLSTRSLAGAPCQA